MPGAKEFVFLARRSMTSAAAGLVLVAFDRATLPWHAGQVLRAGESHGGLILFRRTVRKRSSCIA
jgi:hypothetical protein